MTSSAAVKVDNPFFARIWPTIAAHETEQIRALRRENLAGLSGRVLEVGAGTGTNFAFYPESVAQVVAVEPEHRLAVRARAAAAGAHVPVVVSDEAVERLFGHRAVRRGGVLAGAVLGERPRFRSAANCFRVCGRAASCGIWSMWPPAGSGAGSSDWSTRRYGRGWRVTAIPTATPSSRSAPRDSKWTIPESSGRCRRGRRCRCRSSCSAGRGVRPSSAGRAAAAAMSAAPCWPSRAR